VQAASAATARGEGAAVRRRPSDGGEGRQRNADGRWAEEWEGVAQAMSPAGRWMGGGCGTGHAAGGPWKGMVQRRGREGRGWWRGTVPQVHSCDSRIGRKRLGKEVEEEIGERGGECAG
jgi:hypothetical protein